jgi:tetratricopeptide (TPR) repeat protein
MPHRHDAPRDLLVGLLALQNGMVTRDQLVSAFGMRTTTPGSPLADILTEQGALRPEHRPLLDALTEAHLKLHDGDAEKSLADLDVSPSTCEYLAASGGPEVEATLAYVRPATGPARAGHTAPYAVDTATAGVQRFRVLRPYARGGLGAVFVALDSELNREVALKQILDHHADDPASRTRFLVEAEITGGLEHPGIVPVYGLGTYGDGRPYYAMRFIRGDSLGDAIGRFHADAAPRAEPGRRSLELRKLLRRFLDVCNAIEYAHSRGVVHRDIKPGNVIVGKHGETLVVDWGLAKPLGKVDAAHDDGERTLVPTSASGSAETLPGSVLGTPTFMSPEQAAGDLDQLGVRSDVYSLGATLYCVLTGKAPFDGKVADVLDDVQRGRFRPPRALDPSIDRALEVICLKAMATRPENRYASCRALADDIERWMADEAVAAWKEPWTRTLIRWLARHRTGVTGAAAALLAAVFGLGAVLVVQTEANRLLEGKNQDLRASNAELDRQRMRAMTAEGEARKRADELQEVSKFQSQMLAQLDPAEAGLRLTADVKARFEDALAKAGLPDDERARQAEAFTSHWSRVNATDAALELIDGAILKPAVKAVDNQFRDQPLVDSALRHTLGELYQGLGLYQDAKPLLEGALATRERVLGDAHRDTLSSMTQLGNLLKEQSQYTEAVTYYRRVLDTSRRVFGEADELTLETLGTMGTALVELDKTDEAAPYQRESLDGLRRLKGDDDEKTLTAMIQMGYLLRKQGKFGDAETLLRQVLETRRRILGADHRDTIFMLHQLAAVLTDAGKIEEAAIRFRAALEGRQRVHGEVHPMTLNTMSALGDSLARLGKDADAEALMREALAIERRLLGPDNRTSLAALNNLAVFLIQHHKEAEAEPMCHELLERQRRSAGPAHPLTLVATNVMAYALLQQHKPAQAEPYLREAIDMSRRINGEEHPDTLIYIHNLAQSLLEQKKWSDTEMYFRAVAETARRSLDPAHPTTARATINLGVVLTAQRRFADAVELLAAEEPQVRKSSTPASQRNLAQLLTTLAKARIGLGQFEAAEGNLLDALSLYMEKLNKPPAGVRDCQRAFVELYTEWDASQPGKGYDRKASEWKAKLGLPDLPADVFARP